MRRSRVVEEAQREAIQQLLLRFGVRRLVRLFILGLIVG
jgi:hypothetical protein